MLYPTGLINPSVNCWLNALVQGLISCPSFCRVIRENVREYADNDMFLEFFYLINQTGKGLPSEDSPAKIIKAITSIKKKTNFIVEIAKKQQCVDEVFSFIIEALNCPDVTRLFTCRTKRVIACPKCAHENVVYDKSFRKFISDTKVTEESFKNDIIKTKTIVETYKCPECGHCPKTIEIIEATVNMPPIQVAIFNKFLGRFISEFPREFSLRDKSTSEILKYQLVAQIEHEGSLDHGHYYAVAARQSQKGPAWFILNDQFVSKIADREFNELPFKYPVASTFMVFYDRN